ncbi:protein FAM47E-like [Onychomys torridus]|uniref:protein FAM47E-like n=1 Tax=Onychomys torridus TaxID=38674 RepID=UPI00167FB140|nr:protein FAM47E-like [Onychomys torridus]
MGDHRMPGNQARRTIKPISQDTTGKSVWKDSSKCFVKHRKEPLRLPTSVEGQHRPSVKERPDDFRKVGTASEELTPRSMEGTIFPTIFRGMPSPVANKTPRKQTDDSGVYHPLLPVQQTRRTFWDDIGFRQNQNLLTPWPRGEENSADILIKMLETPRPNRILEYKWPYWEDYREASKQPTNTGKQSQGKLDVDSHKLPWSCEGPWLHDGKHRGQDMLSSIYYKYIYKGGDDVREWAEYYRDAMKQTDTGYENQPSYEESSAKKTDLPTFDLKYGKKMNKGKDIRLNKQDSNFNTKLSKQHDPHKASKDFRYESSLCLKNHRLKTLENEDTITDSNELELQGENIGNPEIAGEAYEPTDWRYFISKEETTPSTLEQMFMKRRWGYECSTPASNTFKDCYWIMDTGDDDDDDNDDNHKEEEEKAEEQKKENN